MTIDRRKTARSTADTVIRKTYRPPALSALGPLHRLTNGPINTASLDGSSGMSPRMM